MKKSLLLRILFFWFLALLISTNTIYVYAQGSGYALEFDGIDDYVTIFSDSSDELNPQNAVTIESWIYLSEPASATHRPHYLGKIGSYQLIIETNGLPKFYTREDTNFLSVTGTTTIETGKWYHIAVTFDGLNIRIYVNGKMEGVPQAKTQPLEQNYNDVLVGGRFGGIASLSGSMDEIRIWDVARTETELQNGMSMKLVGNESNLLGYWRLDEGSGTITTDLTVNGNNGTLTNMDASSDWITSIAPVGDASIFAESSDITETSNCETDIVFGTGIDAPGPGYSMAAIQVNESPNDNTGLEYTLAGMYWEIWSEDRDFDNDFTATVHFHYDNVSGIIEETDLVLYRRDNANAATWSSVSGYSIITDDGASSTTNDGIGYIQLDISEATSGGFGGQYILGWNLRPVANDDTDSTNEETLVIIDVLNNDSDSESSLDPSTVSISGDPSHGTITNINAATGEITYSPVLNYSGTDQFSYTVNDDVGATSNIALVTVNINPINDPPIVTDIPGQTIAEGEVFTTISLDDFVSDIEDPDTDIVWSWSGNLDLTITIDSNRIATIGIPDENWNGNESIVFTATDQNGGLDSDTAAFTVTPVNDPPVITDIQDQTIAEGEIFTTISLDDFVSDVEDIDSDITWSWSGNLDLTINIDSNRIATIGIPDGNWNGNESIVFTATDQDGSEDSDTVAFTVIPVNDLPVVTDIPDQTISEGEVFTTISLDDFVSDIEDPNTDIVWSGSGNLDLTITIDSNRIATIGIPDENWNGNETITFTATDLNGGQDSDMAIFTVTPDNDPPVVFTQISDTAGATLEEFIFQFDSLAFSDIDEEDTLTYSAALTTGDLPDWLSFNAATRTFSGTPASEDIGLYILVVTAYDRDMESATDTFEIQIIRGVLGIIDLTEERNLNVYPNPVRDIVFIESSKIVEYEGFEFYLFDIVGTRMPIDNRIIYNKNIVEIDLAHIPAGMYIMLIQNDSSAIKYKLTKH